MSTPNIAPPAAVMSDESIGSLSPNEPGYLILPADAFPVVILIGLAIGLLCVIGLRSVAAIRRARRKGRSPG